MQVKKISHLKICARNLKIMACSFSENLRRRATISKKFIYA